MSKRSSRKRPIPPLEAAAVSAPAAPKRGVSLKFILTSLAATLNLTAAMLGLGFPQDFPALSSPPVMVTLFAVGIGLEIWAIRQLLATRRAEMAAGHR